MGEMQPSVPEGKILKAKRIAKRAKRGDRL